MHMNASMVTATQKRQLSAPLCTVARPRAEKGTSMRSPAIAERTVGKQPVLALSANHSATYSQACYNRSLAQA